MVFLRHALIVLLSVLTSVVARAEDILFIGNSFTIGSAAPAVSKNGGVPKLVEAIAQARGKPVQASAVMAGGKNWTYHLAQPGTGKMLSAKTWKWVVLQDESSRPTHMGNVGQFLRDGETFSDKIAATSPAAGIVLFETWARPPGWFYNPKAGHGFSSPAQMLAELHQSYARLHDDLAARNPHRPVRVALVGTAFARAATEYPQINLYAPDRHHGSLEGYYLAALVIYETIYSGSVLGAPTQFYHGALSIPADEAAKLQAVADEVVGGAIK